MIFLLGKEVHEFLQDVKPELLTKFSNILFLNSLGFGGHIRVGEGHVRGFVCILNANDQIKLIGELQNEDRNQIE